MPGHPADQLAKQAARQEHGQFGMFRDRNARHRSFRSCHLCVVAFSDGNPDSTLPAQGGPIPKMLLDHGVSGPRPEHSEGFAGGQLWITANRDEVPLRPARAGRKEAVEAGHAGIRIGEVAGQRPQVAGRGEKLRDAANSPAEIGRRRKPESRARKSAMISTALLRLERADAIDQQAARLDQLDRAREQRALQRRQRRDVAPAACARARPDGAGWCRSTSRAHRAGRRRTGSPASWRHVGGRGCRR